MFNHVMVGVSDLDRAKAFYDKVFEPLGVGPGFVDRHRIFWMSPSGVFGASIPIDGQPPTVGNGSTIGFKCETPEQAKAWHDAGVAAGGTSIEDPPGWRELPAGGRMYLAYLRDPDGNKLCAVLRG